jgi:hypothetical protein
MAQALATAELLSKYVTQREMPEEVWMQKFEGERRAMMRDTRIVTNAALWLASHPRVASGAYQTMRAAPALFRHFVSVCGGARRLWGVQLAS